MTMTAASARRTSPRMPTLRGLGWVTWRQHRSGVAGVLVVLGGVSVYLLFSGLSVHHAYTRLGLNTCGPLGNPSCQSQVSLFQQDYFSLADHLPHLLMILPGLIGVFVGAPLLAREFESGTFRFAWTQGRSRVQWIVTKLIVIGTALTLLALAFSLLFTWWYSPFDAISGRMAANGAYEISGLVFAARTLFGFALGAFLGLLIRRTVPAMAATAAIWFAVLWSTTSYLRPLIRQPITILGRQGKGTVPGSGGLPFNADVTGHWLQNAAGQHVSNDQVFSQVLTATRGTPPTPAQYDTYLNQHHYTQWVSYRPNTWFWHFQTIEASGYIIVAALLAITTVLLLRRRAV
jgi:hypothetical protein